MSLDYISRMNCNKCIKFLVWMGELFAVWDAAMSRISDLCRHFLTCVSTSTRQPEPLVVGWSCAAAQDRKHKSEETRGSR